VVVVEVEAALVALLVVMVGADVVVAVVGKERGSVVVGRLGLA